MKKEELFQELVYMLQGFGLDENMLKSKITMILDRYDIMPRVTAIAVHYSEDCGRMLRQNAPVLPADLRAVPAAHRKECPRYYSG